MTTLSGIPDSVPSKVRELANNSYKVLPTAGDGGCAIHSVYGDYTSFGLFKQNARSFLKDLLGETAGDLQRRVNDPTVMQELRGVLWNDLVKRSAGHSRGMRGTKFEECPESEMVWKELNKTPGLAQRCVDTLIHQEDR